MRASVWFLAALWACDGGGDTDTDPVDTDTNDPVDTDTDAPPPPDWAWCPAGVSDADDDAWDARLTSGGALWCAMGDESFDLRDEPARKAQILLVPGEYPLPHEPVTDAALTLPFCALLAGGERLVSDGDGAVDGWHEAYGDQSWWQWGYTQPMAGGGAGYTLAMQASTLTAPEVTSPTLAWGTDAMLPWGEAFVSASLRAGGYPNYTSNRQFVPCGYEDPPRIDTTSVTFEGGAVDLVVHMGQSMASTEPAMFVEAVGTLDGAGFQQGDYWKLVYNPEHHHFTRDFAVIFDAPIGDACGLAVTGVDAYYSDTYGTPATVATVGCDLETIATRAVISQITDRVAQ